MAQATTVFVLNGPNLNLLGTREPGIYGRETLGDVEALCRRTADPLGIRIDFRQTNHEGVLVDWVQEAAAQAGGIVLNAAAYTHTSVALLDALRAFDGPVIEVHVSNVYAREPFRHHSYVSARADGVMCGVGVAGYALALEAIAPMLDAPPAGKTTRQ